jgi:hypothetical protein
MAGYSQEAGSCAEKLKTAQSLFEKGQVEQVPELLNGCLKSGFSREESLEAYKLLIQTYLLEDKPEAADSVMLAFLKKNPEYEASPTDHSSFVSLFNNYVSRIIIQASLHVGSNLPFVMVSDSRSVMSSPGDKKYTAEPLNFFISGEIKYKISSKVEVNAEIGYSQIAFTSSEKTQGNGLSESRESQKRIEIPLSATYDLVKIGILTPYARIGFGTAFNFSSVAATDNTPLDLIPDYKPAQDIQMKSRRIFMDMFVQAGAGFKFKTREGFIFGEVRSNFGLFNQSIIKGYGDSDDLSWLYGLSDDRFRLNTLNVSVGYTRIFYKPSKREK